MFRRYRILRPFLLDFKYDLLTFPCFSYIARSKVVVTRDETSSEPLRGTRSHGGRRPQTSSYWKEKQKIDAKGKAPATSRHARKDVLQDEGYHVVEHREKDLLIARGGTEGDASESSNESIGNEERE
ncbi:hypothetical protein Scep_004406 [Stephania cephalantha]|uniref:Uncharacterized protein n=1 Tax=Stephania cephalantha TaxID=152367 RepID=A0AAP0KU71_9MAGN